MDEIQCNPPLFYNTYESTLKRLIQILKTKTSDNVKQLEDLWDSINNTSMIQPISSVVNTKSLTSRTSPTISSSSQSPIHLSDSSNDSTNSSSNSSTNNLKRDASKMCQSPVNSSSIIAVKKTKLDNAVTNNKIKTKESENVNVIFTLENTNQTKTEVAVDMLDITCTVCKNFNQEPNNKLIECRQCTHLYHQLCHNPVIGNDQLEQQKSNDDQMVWYMSKCNKCETKYENDQTDLEVDKINSAQQEESSPNNNKSSLTNKPNGLVKTELKPNDTWNFKKTSPTNINTNQSNLKSASSISSFSTLSNHNTINNNTLNSSTNTINSNGKTTTLVNSSSTNGIKGLAALATKLNPNGNLQANNLNSPSSTTTSITNSISSSSITTTAKKATTTSANPDSLFKKFKESASSTSLTANENEKKSDMNNSNNASLGKKALVSLQLPSSTSTSSSTTTTNATLDTKKTTNTNGLSKPLVKNGLTTSTTSNTLNGTNTNSTTNTNNLQKKSPFNISNSLTTKTSNSNCVGINNLKDKKTQLKSSTTTSITTNSTTNSNAITRSSKIS